MKLDKFLTPYENMRRNLRLCLKPFNIIYKMGIAVNTLGSINFNIYKCNYII